MPRPRLSFEALEKTLRRRGGAKVPALEGLQVYGHSQKEILAEARKLSAMLLYEGNRRDQRILVFYPGRIPDSAHIAALG